MTKPRDYESYCRALNDKVTKSLSDKVPSDRAMDEAHPGSGQMTRQAHELQRNRLSYDRSRDYMTYDKVPSPKSLSDEGILHGELFLDKEGKAHFICHTPGDMTFGEVRDATLKFIDLSLDQIDRQEECPFS